MRMGFVVASMCTVNSYLQKRFQKIVFQSRFPPANIQLEFGPGL